MKKVAIIMGSDSDVPVVKKATAVLDQFGVEYVAHVYSAHRTPVEAGAFADSLAANGFRDEFTHSLGHGVGVHIHESPFMNTILQIKLLF